MVLVSKLLTINGQILSFDKLTLISRRHSRESGNPLNCRRWIPAVVYPREDGGRDDGLVLEVSAFICKSSLFGCAKLCTRD